MPRGNLLGLSLLGERGAAKKFAELWFVIPQQKFDEKKRGN